MEAQDTLSPTYSAVESDSQRENNSRVRVLIVDDHPVTRQGLCELLKTRPDMEVCGEAANMADAMRMVEQTEPDVAIVDVSLANGNGIELIKQIKAHRADIKILVFSMHDESLYAERALRAGALGYIGKGEDIEMVFKALQSILAGRVYLNSNAAGHILQHLVSGGDKKDRPTVGRLSDRELEVFESIGRGLTTQQIATNLGLSRKTIETYRENIKAKLDLANATELTCRAAQWLIERTTSTG